MNEKFKERLYLSEEEVRNKAKELLKLDETDKVTTILFLQERINKAIEYVNDEIKQEAFHHYLDDEDIQELLKILKGE